jgi:ComF family protein
LRTEPRCGAPLAILEGMEIRSLLNAIAPPLCAGCGAHAGATEPLCRACRTELRWLGREPAPLAAEAALSIWAPVAYEGPARGVVRALKFRGASAAAPAMAAQMAANAPPGWLAGDAALVPVPLHPARARKRGYNQAALLAGALAERTGLDVSDCLERCGPRGTQVGRDRRQRLAGIPGSIRVAAGREAPGTAVLVDDVITTGATLVACARALRENGAREVLAIGYARTPGR